MSLGTEFTRVQSTDSMDDHYLKVIKEQKTVKINVEDQEEIQPQVKMET